MQTNDIYNTCLDISNVLNCLLYTSRDGVGYLFGGVESGQHGRFQRIHKPLVLCFVLAVLTDKPVQLHCRGEQFEVCLLYTSYRAYSSLSATGCILSGVSFPSVPQHRCKCRSVFPVSYTHLRFFIGVLICNPVRFYADAEVVRAVKVACFNNLCLLYTSRCV